MCEEPGKRIGQGKEEEIPLYEKDGEQYFVVDGHVHYWDARPENRNKYGAGFINCFYDYHKNLSPEEYVWPKEKYDRYSEEDLIHDLFEVGYVDVAVDDVVLLAVLLVHVRPPPPT